MKTSTVITYAELCQQPDGVIFCEDDLPTAPLFIKRASLQDDISIEPIFDQDDGPRCLGCREMDSTTRNSLRFHVLTSAERERAILMLIGPYVLSS